MNDTRREAAAEARACLDEPELRRRLKEIRDSGLQRLTDDLARTIGHEKEFGPARDTFAGDPIPRPQLSDIESVAGACLLLLERLEDDGTPALGLVAEEG